jgi:hypothetical protein
MLKHSAYAEASEHLRKEVIQPHLPVRLPCYDFAPITGLTLDAYKAASGTPGFHGVTGGVYKARERIHRGVLTPDY